MVWLRVAALGGRLLSAHAESPALVKAAGLLQRLLAELNDPKDLLGCMVALEVLAEMLEQGEAAQVSENTTTATTAVVLAWLACLAWERACVWGGGLSQGA